MNAQTNAHGALISCPEVGAWRAWLDREGDSTGYLADHLASCAGCQRVVDDLRDAALISSELLGGLAARHVPSGAAVAVARERLAFQQRYGQQASKPRTPVLQLATRLSTAWRVAATGVAAALVFSVALAISPDVQTYAAGVLSQFRPEQITVVEVNPQSQAEIMRTLSALGNLGTVKSPTGDIRPEAAAKAAHDQMTTVTLAEASKAVGFPIQTPDPAKLPTGVDKTPRVRLVPGSQLRFTFDKNKARTYYQSVGHPEMSLPDRFDGASLVLSIPPAALLEYANPSAKDVLVVGEAGQLVVDVEGKASLDEIRDFLLATPGLPTYVTNQLRTIKEWNQTLPLPVPVSQIQWSKDTFKGNQGLLLKDNSGVGSAAIWYEGGNMYGLAGSIKANDLKPLAESLAVR